jgi:hypothetical protein
MWSGAEWAEPLDVGVVDRQVVGGEVLECALGVDRVVEDDRVDDQAKRAELFFLALAVAELAAVAVATSRASAWRLSPRLSWVRIRRRNGWSLQ